MDEDEVAEETLCDVLDSASGDEELMEEAFGQKIRRQGRWNWKREGEKKDLEYSAIKLFD